MAPRMMEMTLALAVVTMLLAGAAAQSDCTNVLVSLSPCLNYITGNSSTPSSGCCTQLASVVRSKPQCLCQVLNGGGSSLGVNINQTRALALPGDCSVQTPPLSRCNAGAGSPTDSPSGTGTAESPNEVPSDGGSKTVPSTQEGGSSAGSSVQMSISLLFVLLFAGTYASAPAGY